MIQSQSPLLLHSAMALVTVLDQYRTNLGLEILQTLCLLRLAREPQKQSPNQAQKPCPTVVFTHKKTYRKGSQTDLTTRRLDAPMSQCVLHRPTFYHGFDVIAPKLNFSQNQKRLLPAHARRTSLPNGLPRGSHFETLGHGNFLLCSSKIQNPPTSDPLQ